jgi:general secretion pathway protein G
MNVRLSNRKATRAFTLVEILIVVVILGVLAAIVVPQFVSAATDSRISAIHTNVHRIRTQIEVYYQHHNDTFPTLDDFEDQMTAATDVHGNPGVEFGPYLAEIPNNSFTNTNTIGNGAVGSSAWYYDEATGDFRANDSAETRAFP